MVRFPGLVLMVAISVALAGDKPSAHQQELAKLQALVGSWRGVAQPQRGSAKGSWAEQADWAWDFSQPSPALIATLPQGKYFSRLRLTPGDTAGAYHLAATPSKIDQPQHYSGRLDDQTQLVLLIDQPRADAPAGDLPRRLTFRFAAGSDRLLLLMEKQGATADSFARLAEIGYTRVGSGFGNVAQGRECIVTGGLGTIEVSHNGKTYYVCCTGCRDYFNANPEEVLAEYSAKKKSK